MPEQELNSKRWRYSLRLKIAAGLLLLLVIVMVGSSYLRYVSYRELLIQDLAFSAGNTGTLVRGCLLLAQRAGDYAPLQQTLDRLATQPELDGLYLLNGDGRVLLSSGGRLVDQRLELPEAAPQMRSDEDLRPPNLIQSKRQGARRYSSIQTYGDEEQASPGPERVAFLVIEYSSAHIDAQLASYLRSRALLSVGTVLLILLIADLMLSRIVVSKLRQFLVVIQQLKPGNLDARVTVRSQDEIGELGAAFNRMADGLKEKEELEREVQERTQQLQREAEKLSVLNTLALTVSQSLNLSEVLLSALDEVLALLKLRAGWIVLRDGQGGELDLVTSRGLPEKVVLAHRQCAWDRSACNQVLDLGRAQAFPISQGSACPVAKYFEQEGLVFRACVPLISKSRVLGIMSLVGDESSRVQELTEDTLEMLTAIGRQIGIAAENAGLNEALRQKAAVERQLLDKVITAQEEERKRIARELHDQTGQALTSVLMTLKVMEEADAMADVQASIQDLRDATSLILRDVRALAVDLRPTLLDDLGLQAALRHYTREFQAKVHLLVDLQVLGMGSERLPAPIETALYRITQEALNNVTRHAQAHNVTVLLENRGSSVRLIVEDDGQGFDVTRLLGAGPHEGNLGLYGMRERASLLGGSMTIESTPGIGTTVFVEIPLERG